MPKEHNTKENVLSKQASIRMNDIDISFIQEIPERANFSTLVLVAAVTTEA